MGLVNNGFLEKANPAAFALEKVSGEAIDDDRFETRTRHDEGLDWKIFRHSGYLPRNFESVAGLVQVGLLLLPQGVLNVGVSVIMQYLRELSSDAVASPYTHRLFPEILKIPSADAHFGKIDAGENLLRRVYEALSANREA